MVHMTNVVAIAQADAIATETDGGAGAAVMEIYDDTGAIPTDADVAISTQVLLVSIPLNDPAYGGGGTDGTPGGLLTLDITPIPEADAVATGTANFARIVDSDLLAVTQLDTVTVTSGGGELEINSIEIQSGAAVQITGPGTVLVPES